MRAIPDSVLGLLERSRPEIGLAVLSLCLTVASQVLAQDAASFDSGPAIGDPYGRKGLTLGSYAIYPDAALIVSADDKGRLTPSLKSTLHILKRSGRQSVEGAFSIKGDFADDRLRPGDMSVNAELGIDRKLAPGVSLELDTSYMFDRDALLFPHDAEDREQRVDAYAGIEWRTPYADIKFDTGAALTHIDELRSAGDFDATYVEPDAALRLTAKTGTTLRPFVEAAYVPRRYVRDSSRDYDGYELILGLDAGTSGPVSGEAGIILVSQHYADPQARTQHAIGLNIDMTWRVKDSTQVVLAAATIIDQGVGGQVEGVPVHTIRLEMNHALADGLRFDLSLEAEIENGRGHDDWLALTPALALTWQFNPTAAWVSNVEIEWEKRRGSKTGTLGATLATGLQLRL